MRFRFIEEHVRDFPTNRLCKVLDVSERGLRAYRSRPASQRQRTDMIVLAHIKEQSRLSLCSYGRPRMTEELKELGLTIGHRRVGCRGLCRRMALSNTAPPCPGWDARTVGVGGLFYRGGVSKDASSRGDDRPRLQYVQQQPKRRGGAAHSTRQRRVRRGSHRCCPVDA